MPRFDMKWSTRRFMLFRYDASELMISNCACHNRVGLDFLLAKCPSRDPTNTDGNKLTNPY